MNPYAMQTMHYGGPQYMQQQQSFPSAADHSMQSFGSRPPMGGPMGAPMAGPMGAPMGGAMPSMMAGLPRQDFPAAGHEGGAYSPMNPGPGGLPLPEYMDPKLGKEMQKMKTRRLDERMKLW